MLICQLHFSDCKNFWIYIVINYQNSIMNNKAIKDYLYTERIPLEKIINTLWKINSDTSAAWI